MAISSNGTTWDIGTATGTINISTNTTYYARLTWDGTTYRTLLSTDGNTYNQDMQLAGTNRPFPTTIYIGGCETAGTGHTAHPFGGTIDLNKAFIYVAGQLFWHGMDNVGLESRADINLGNITEEGKQVIRDTVDVSGKEDKLTAVAPVYTTNLEIEPMNNITVDGNGHLVFNKGAESCYGGYSRREMELDFDNRANLDQGYIELPYHVGQAILLDRFQKGGTLAQNCAAVFGHYEGDTFVPDWFAGGDTHNNAGRFSVLPVIRTTLGDYDEARLYWCTKGTGEYSREYLDFSHVDNGYPLESAVMGVQKDGNNAYFVVRRYAGAVETNSCFKAEYPVIGAYEGELLNQKLDNITTVRIYVVCNEISYAPVTTDITAANIGVCDMNTGYTVKDIATQKLPIATLCNVAGKVGVTKPIKVHKIGVTVDNTTIEVNGNGELQTTVDINNLETRVEALEQGGGGSGGDVFAGGDNTFTGYNTFDNYLN